MPHKSTDLINRDIRLQGKDCKSMSGAMHCEIKCESHFFSHISEADVSPSAFTRQKRCLSVLGSNYYRYKNAVTFAVSFAVTFDSVIGRRMP